MSPTDMLAAIAATRPRLAAHGRCRWAWSRSAVVRTINGLPVYQIDAPTVVAPALFASAEADLDAALVDVWRRATKQPGASPQET